MRINDIPWVMLYCLGSTIIVEGLLALLWGVRKRSEQLVVLLCNVLTNPLLVSVGYLILLRCGTRAWNIATAGMEAAAVLIEGSIYRAFLTRQKHPFWLSLTLNAGSFLAGMGLNAILFS